MLDPTEQAKKEQYVQEIDEYLAEEGYRPRIDDDRDVVFKSEGMTLIATVVPSEDGAFFYIRALFEASNVKNPLFKSLAFDQVNNQIRCVKMHNINTNGDFAIGVEAFYSSVEEFLKHIERYIRICDQARESFAEHIKELSGHLDEMFASDEA